jgi:uncharacterized protein with PQ loop repeat
MRLISGVIVAFIFLAAYVPQLKSLWKSKEINGVSTFFWMLIALSTATTASNLWEAHAVWYVFIPQYLNATIAVIILLWVSYKKEKIVGLWIMLMTYSFLISILAFKLDNEFVQMWASIFIFLAYLEQIIHMITKKTAQGINPLLYIGFAIGLLIMASNIFYTGAPVSAAVTEMTNFSMIVIATIITYIYKKK